MSDSMDNSYEKLEQVLQLFLTPNFNVVSTTYLDLLLTHIKNAVTSEDNQKTFHIIRNWLTTALNTWNISYLPAQNLIVFTIKLIGSVSVNESDFLSLSQNDTHTKACEIFSLQTQNLPASIKMAFSTTLVNLLEHHSGRQWIAKTEAWKQILMYAQQNHTMYVTRECHKFLSKLLILESENEIFCKEIILTISEPLMKVTIDSQAYNKKLLDNQLLNMNKQLHCEQMNLLQATLEMLLEILDFTTFYDFQNPVPAMFEKFVSIESRMKTIFETTISTPMMKVVQKLVKLLIFVKLRSSIKETDEVISEEVFEQFTIELFYHSMMLVTKNFITDFILSKKLGYEYWLRLKKIKPVNITKQYRFEDQNMALMFLPFYTILKPAYMKKHYLFEEFVNKMFDITCTPVQRLAYTVRDILLKNDLPIESICVVTVNYLLEMADILDRTAAVMVFQILCHALKNFVMESSQDNKSCNAKEHSSSDGSITNSGGNNVLKKQLKTYFLDGDPINDKKTLLAALLNGLNTFTEKYKLKWQECVETICILSIAQDILNHTGVDSKICILALKTCKLSIQNFMPPNLALLVDFDEYTKQIGPTLFKRIHDTNWEVQDSVLEILNTIACLSENKYPPYQSFLLENNFLEVAIEITKNEGESYVRASALTFISTAVRINTLWEKLLSQSNLLDIALKILYSESEAIVRREAVTLIKALYVHRKWQKSVINTMSHAMTAAAVLDLHWEVKVNALEFWRHYIKSHLTDQGMLDGHFPTVTFSKQHRKIVSLDEEEIKQRLNKALDELSQNNCLGVLLATLKDESDFEVSKTSANIIGDLRHILLKYKIDEPKQPSPPPEDIPTIDSSYKKSLSKSTAQTNSSKKNVRDDDAVIEAIIDATDANLLAAIYNDSMKMDESTDIMEKNNGKETYEYVKSITRHEFLSTILKFDLDDYIQKRSQWLQHYTVSFNSVLDDILVISDQKEINSMDCY